jgi:hypothetical protein
MQTKTHLQGVTILEYTLVGMLLLVASLAGWQLLSSNIFNSVQIVKQDMRQKNKATASYAQRQAKLLATINEFKAATDHKINQVNTQFCNANTGSCSSIENSIDAKAAIETLGANGSINLMGDKFALLGAQLLASGKIDEAQAGIFNDLANQAYKLGAISGTIEQIAKNCNSDTSCFTTTTVSYNGQQMTASQLSNLIGYQPTDNGNTTNNPEVDNLWNIYKNLPPTVWTDPALKETVTSLSMQVARTTDLVRWGSSNIQNGYMSPSEMQNHLTTQAQGSIPQSAVAQGQTAQSSIDKDSGTICTSGNGASKNNTCN